MIMGVVGEYQSVDCDASLANAQTFHVLKLLTESDPCPLVHRCCLESAVSSELLARIGAAYPKMLDALVALPAKLFILSETRSPEEVLLSTDQLDTRMQTVMAQIQSATFTGKGDKEQVPLLYENYVARIAPKGRAGSWSRQAPRTSGG